ncbi:hypothetical protein D3C76_1103010 [compost metagenome]
MVDRVDQHRHAQGVREQDELLAYQAIARVAGVGQEADAFEPLLFGQLNLTDESVQVPDQALHDLFVARIRRVGEAVHRLLGDELFDGFVLIGHCSCSDMGWLRCSGQAGAWPFKARVSRASIGPCSNGRGL